jgi:hypothetical protein
VLRIYGYAASINVRKVLWTCAELDLDFERERHIGRQYRLRKLSGTHLWDRKARYFIIASIFGGVSCDCWFDMMGAFSRNDGSRPVLLTPSIRAPQINSQGARRYSLGRPMVHSCAAESSRRPSSIPDGPDSRSPDSD